MTGPSIYEQALKKTGKTKVDTSIYGMAVAKTKGQNLPVDQHAIEDDQSDLPSQFINLGKFMGSVFSDPNNLNPLSQIKRQVTHPVEGLETIGDIGSNILTSGKNLLGYLADKTFTSGNTLQGIQQDLAMKVGQQLEQLKAQQADKSLPDAAVHLAGQTLLGILKQGQQIVEASTGLVNNLGNAIPATPEQQAKNIQGAVGTVAQFSLFGGIKAAMLPLGATMDEAVGLGAKSTLGKLGEVIKANVTATSISGAAQAGISEMGSNSQADAIIGQAITYAPLGVALGMLGGKKAYEKAIQENIARLDPTTKIASDLAGLNSIRNNANKSFAEIGQDIDVTKESDNLIQAGIRSRISKGLGFAIKGLPDEKVLELENLNPKNTPEPSYELHPALAKGRVTYKGVEIKFKSDLDKLAYVASKAKKGKNDAMYIEDAIKKTGLTESEIKTHGKAVRSEIKAQVEQKRFNPRPQQEIDAVTRETIDRGKAKLSMTNPGNTFQDHTGKTWSINEAGNMSDGSLTYPKTSQEAMLIAGRVPRDESLFNPFIDLDKQKFQPDFGKGKEKFTVLKNGDVTYFHPQSVELTVDDLRFFDEYGYMPGEVVNYNGIDYGVVKNQKGKISFQSIADNTFSKLPIVAESEKKLPGWFKEKAKRENINTARIFNDYDLSNPSVVTAIKNDPSLTEVQKQEVLRTGSLGVIRRSENFPGFVSSSSLVPNLYKEFLPVYDASKESFESTFSRFMQEHNIRESDYTPIQTHFFKQLAEDLSNKYLDKEEISIKSRLITELDNPIEGTGVVQKQYQNQQEFINHFAKSNGYYFSSEGAGKYRIADIRDGKTIYFADSPDEALKFITNSGQTNSLDLDGGITGVVPTLIAKVGPGEYPVPKANWADELRITGHLPEIPIIRSIPGVRDLSASGQALFGTYFKKIVPPAHFMASLDALGNQKTNWLRDIFTPLQDAQLKRQLKYNELSSSKDKAEGFLGLAAKVDPLRLEKISNAVESFTADEIKANFLNRPMNELELKFAHSKLKDVSTLQVVKLLRQVKATIGEKSWASHEAFEAIKVLGKDDASTIKAAQALAQATKYNQQIFSPQAVLEYAKKLESPETSISRKDFMAKNNFSAKEKLLVEKLDDYFKSAFSEAGISDKRQISGYLPHIESGEIFNSPETVNVEFARALTRFLNDGSSLERNPIKLVMTYHRQLINHLSGFNETMAQVEKSFELNSEVIKQDPRLYPATKKVQQYIDNVKGIPDIDDQLAKGADGFFKRMGLKNPNPNSVLALYSLGQIAARPALAARDITQAYITANAAFGSEFANKIFGDGISDEYLKGLETANVITKSKSNVESLQQAGTIPKMQVGQLIDPESKFTELQSASSTASKVFNKTVETGYKLGMQDLIYNKILAGAYKATFEIGGKAMDKFTKGEITEEQLVKVLKLEAHNPTVQKIVLDYAKAGKTGEALDFLGKWNGRYISNIFGFNNNPVGWKSNFGRILGQYGSWGANQGNVLLDMASRGSKGEITGRLLRMGIMNTALVTAGYTAGVDLKNWVTGNPFTTLPGIGPVAEMAVDLPKEWYRNGSDGMVKAVTRDAKGFIPFYKAWGDWNESYDLLSKGHMQGIPVGLGMKPKK